MEPTKENLEQSLRTYFNIAAGNKRQLSKEVVKHQLFILDGICQDFNLKILSKEIRQFIDNNLN